MLVFVCRVRLDGQPLQDRKDSSPCKYSTLFALARSPFCFQARPHRQPAKPTLVKFQDTMKVKSNQTRSHSREGGGALSARPRHHRQLSRANNRPHQIIIYLLPRCTLNHRPTPKLNSYYLPTGVESSK